MTDHVHGGSARFGPWLFEKPSKLVGWLGAAAVSILSVVLSNAKRLEKGTEDSLVEWLRSNAVTLSYGLQLTVIVVLGVVAAMPFRKRFRPGLRANMAVAQFRTAWVCFLLSMALVYAVHLARQITVQGAGSTRFDVADALVGYIANMFLFLMYVVLSKITVSGASTAQPWPFLPWIGLTILLASFRVFCVLHGPSVWMSVSEWLDAVTGAIALAMLVGRLESIYVGAPPGVVALLYVYAALQMTQIAEGNPGYQENVKPVLAAVALPLKLVFFVFVQWTIATGRLVFYMARVREVLEHVDDERDAFLKAVSRPAMSVEMPKEIAIARGAITDLPVELNAEGAVGKISVTFEDLPPGVKVIAANDQGDVCIYKLKASEAAELVEQRVAGLVATDEEGNAVTASLLVSVRPH